MRNIYPVSFLFLNSNINSTFQSSRILLKNVTLLLKILLQSTENVKGLVVLLLPLINRTLT